MKITTVTLLMFVVLATTAGRCTAQDSFNSLLSFGVISSETEANSKTEANRLGLSFYLKPVRFSNVPYGLAAFVDMHSVFHISAVQNDINNSTANADIDTYGFTYLHRIENNPLFFGFNVSKSDTSGESILSDISGERDDKHVTIGYFFDKFTMLNLSYGTSEGEIDYGAFTEEIDSSSYELGYILLRPINDTQFIQFNFEAEFSDNNDVNKNIYETTVRFHFNKSTAIGAGYISVSSDDPDDEGHLTGVTTSVFPSPLVGLGITYGEFSAKEDSDDNEDYLSFMMEARF